jgi:hypothetical protein
LHAHIRRETDDWAARDKSDERGGGSFLSLVNGKEKSEKERTNERRRRRRRRGGKKKEKKKKKRRPKYFDRTVFSLTQSCFSFGFFFSFPGELRVEKKR